MGHVSYRTVTRATLLDFFLDFAARPAPFLVHHDGYRSRTYPYAQLGRAAHRLAARFHDYGLRKGDPLLLWSENRPEWIVAFWAALLRGIVVVPIDYRSPAAFVDRVRGVVSATAIFTGDDVETGSLAAGTGLRQ